MKLSKKVKFAIATVITTTALLAGCTEGSKRVWKSTVSDLSGGINRTVTVYDYNGNEINHWTGKFDVSESENEVYFDLNGKRVIIHGGIVIDEEN